MTANNPATPEGGGKPAFLIRGQKVQLDLHMAEQYGISRKQLRQQVRRNHNRFPADFMFELFLRFFILLVARASILESIVERCACIRDILRRIFFPSPVLLIR